MPCGETQRRVCGRGNAGAKAPRWERAWLVGGERAAWWGWSRASQGRLLAGRQWRGDSVGMGLGRVLQDFLWTEIGTTGDDGSHSILSGGVE